MEELDDLDTGTEVDLWDHKLAAEMRVLQEIFAEVVDKNARVADHGRILDPTAASSRTTPTPACRPSSNLRCRPAPITSPST